MTIKNKEEGLRILQNNLNRDVVLEYIKEFNKLNKKQSESEKALEIVFEQYRKAANSSEVLIKVILLNHIYSAGLNDNLPLEENPKKKRIVDVYTMSNQLASVSNELDRLFYNDSMPSEAIEKILAMFDTKKYNRPFSFATKYCHWHNPEKYPISDSFSRGVLYHFNKLKYKDKYKQNDYLDYSIFCKIYSDFSQEECIKGLSIKEIDKFLWKFGKDYNIKVE